MKALLYLALAAALVVAGVYAGRASAPKDVTLEVVDPYKTPPPPPGFVVDPPQDRYQADPAVMAQLDTHPDTELQNVQAQADANADRRAFLDRQQAAEASYQRQRALEDVSAAVQHEHEH